jgi:hypothetical protein
MNWKKEVEEFKKQMKPEASIISGRTITFGFFGSVGGGKSVTAGIFAVGITPKGLIGWVDGEGHRSGWAIDIVAEMAAKKYGGTKASWVDRFRVIHIEPPFNPLKVIAATEALEEMGCATIIEDVMSQAWDSEGGYLDLKDEVLNKMAGEDEAKKKRSAAAAAAAVKPWTHQRLVNKLTTPKTNLVLLFQAKQKFNANTSKPNEFQSPIQESGLTRTALAVGLVTADEQGVGGICSFELPLGQGTKFTHYAILQCLPENGQRLTFDHAEAILKLCGGAPNATAVQSKPNDLLKKAKAELWNLFKPVNIDPATNKPPTDWSIINAILWKAEVLDGGNPDHAVEKLSLAGLEALINQVRAKIEITKPATI